MYAVYIFDAYHDHSPGQCIGIGFTAAGAREIIASYRCHMGRVYCDMRVERRAA